MSQRANIRQLVFLVSKPKGNPKLKREVANILRGDQLDKAILRREAGASKNWADGVIYYNQVSMEWAENTLCVAFEGIQKINFERNPSLTSKDYREMIIYVFKMRLQGFVPRLTMADASNVGVCKSLL